MSDLCVRGGASRALFNRLIAALFIGALAAPAFAAEPITVQLDRARLIKLPERASTVVIGDPLIADLSVQPGGLAVITGKGYGATNVIVLDHDGAVLSEQTVLVKGPTDPTVVVYRGTIRETYSCTPECSRRITLGDDPDYFDKTLDQVTTRNSQATTAGTQSQAGGGGGSGSASNGGGVAVSGAGGGITITIRNPAGGGVQDPGSRH